MTQGFESVENELEQKRLQLEQDLAALRGQEAELEAALERVHEALGALSGAGKKKARRSGSRSKKPAPSIADLQRHLEGVRSETPFADGVALEKAVRELVRASGASLTGFKRLFAEALLTSPGSAHATSGHGASPSSSHGHGSHSQSSHHGHGHSHGSHDDSPFPG
jgi:hypothetical protein